jgi:hypothetical protein
MISALIRGPDRSDTRFGSILDPSADRAHAKRDSAAAYAFPPNGLDCGRYHAGPMQSGSTAEPCEGAAP